MDHVLDVNSETASLYAIKAYDSPQCLKSEFKDDFKHFNYVKRLFHRYRRDKVLKERLILNHLVLIYNTFQSEAATRLLFFYVHEFDHPVLKTFLLYLSRMPDKIRGVKGKDIYSYDIPIDPVIVRFLKFLK